VKRKPRRTSFERVITSVFVVVLLGSILIGFSQTKDPWARLGFSLVALFAGGALGWGWIRETIIQYRVKKLLRPRESLDQLTFGETFFSDVPGGPELAAAVRRQLEEHMDMELSGLLPDDRLADLYAELDPVFFDELGRKFGFSPPDNYPEFAELVSSLITVRDLVEYVARKIQTEAQ
jgi:hypothetical protein